MTPKMKQEDILDQLRVVTEIAKVPILESEMRAIASRLVKYHGPDLARLIASLPGDRYFPSAWEIEQRIRKATGKPPLKGLTEELIAENEKNCVLSGQSVAKAKIGAEVMRATLRRKEPPADPLDDLADFGETIDPLAGLEEF